MGPFGRKSNNAWNMLCGLFVKRIKHLNFKKMKKLGILILVLVISGAGMVMAQQQQPQNKEPVRQYIQKNVLPVIKQEQGIFINSFSNKEKQKLAEIKSELKTFRAQGQKVHSGMKGNFNPQIMQARKKAYNAIMAKVKILIAAHPKASAAYKTAIEAQETKWEQDIRAIRNKNMNFRGHRQGMGRNQQNTPFMLNRMSNPAFGLLVDVNNFQMNGRMMMRFCTNWRRDMHRQNMGMWGYRSGMNGRMYAYRERMNRERRHYMMMELRNPAVRKKILVYARKNIFPVLSQERIAFDNMLRNSEKRDIEVVRKRLAEVRLQLQHLRKNKGMSRGQVINDSTRMALRLEIQKSLITVQQIALRHYSELQAYLKKININRPKWKAGIHGILGQNMKGNNRGEREAFMKSRKLFSSGVRFLLYDPAHPDENMIMGKNRMIPVK